jgi:hypothetical protein
MNSKCKKCVRQFEVLKKKLNRIQNRLEDKENQNKLQLQQMLLALNLFEAKFYLLHLTKEERYSFIATIKDIREQLYDIIAAFQ